ncbi:MAG: hydantoinase/oxoprolinase family protein [Pseudomonadota bacterium]
MALRYRLGIDVGGTFTDFVLAREDGGRFAFHKEPSVPDDPSRAVEAGTAHLIQAEGIAPGDVALVVHGTTLALNAIIRQRGAKVALVVSRGNRDVMEIARARMPNSYDFTAGRETPLIGRESVYEVSARGLSDGSIMTPADPEEIAAVAKEISAAGHDAIAVMLLNSYRDGTLEREVAAHLRAAARGLPVVASADIWPEMREYERALVTALNAYIHPLMDAYFDRLEERFKGLGVTAPLYITANNGGTISLATARARPVDTVLSGPASGVLAATRIGDHPALLTFDMGGTSTDIAVSEAGRLEFTNTTMIGDYPLMLPVVNVSAIGSGGGSIVWTDPQGLLKVGPDSAGADPGPVAYGRGGTHPTMTDCYLTLGIVDPDGFNDGKMRLDAAAAADALGEVAAAVGLDGPVGAADAAVRVATAKMATELRKLLAQRGLDPRGFVLCAYGGAGPTHANFLAEEAMLDAVLVPRLPGTFCALGAILADVRRDYVRPARQMVERGGAGWPRIEALIEDAAAEARAWVAEEGDLIGAHELRLTADMRYPAQAFELPITVPHFTPGTLQPSTLFDLYNAEHQRLYGFAEEDSDLEITNLRLAVVGKVAPISVPRAQEGSSPASNGTRRIFVAGGWHEAALYMRDTLHLGARIDGPAVVQQPDSTVLILPGWAGSVDAYGNLVIRRAGQ